MYVVVKEKVAWVACNYSLNREVNTLLFLLGNFKIIQDTYKITYSLKISPNKPQFTTYRFPPAGSKAEE